MHYLITKLDRRHSWHNAFEYMLRFNKGTALAGTGVLDFDRGRRWLTQTFGWSQDVETRHRIHKISVWRTDLVETDDLNPTWAYSVAYDDYRIYLCSDKELEWFILKFPQQWKSQ